jgi:hypothetical protein
MFKKKGVSKKAVLGIHERCVFLMNESRTKVKWEFPRSVIRDWGANGHRFSLSVDATKLAQIAERTPRSASAGATSTSIKVSGRNFLF